MNPSQIEAQITKSRGQIDEILDQVKVRDIDGNPTFHMPNDEARTLLTSMAGLTFDVEQSRRGLEREKAVLKQQLELVDEFFDRLTDVSTTATMVVKALMANTPPE